MEEIKFPDIKTASPVDEPAIEHEHLQDLEVDVAKVLEDDTVEDLEADTSPYPEVRAVVPDVDDQAIPVNTLRMWILGFIFTMIGSGINQFFSLRYPSVHIVALVAELLAYLFGVILAKTLPLYTLNLSPIGLGKWCINPDRHFNIKEHTVITIMSNVSFGYASADSTSIIQATSKAFYNFELKPGFSVLVVLCCQMLGFGIAGLSSPWLIEPASIIWPQVLSNCALLSTLHSRANATANGWKISRLRFFFYVMVGSGVWYFFPGLMFVALSYFTWICWIVPKNLVVNHLLGMVTGLGLSPITFDWSQIAYNTNPLLSPSWAAVNVFVGFAIFFWIVTPGLYYSNVWFTAYLPISSADLYDNTGAVYNVSRVLTAANTLDVPRYWYGALTLVILIVAIVIVEVYHTTLPGWAILIAAIVPAFYMVPCGIIQGIANVDANQLNVLSEFVGGYMFTGKPLANMIFKIFSTDVVGQGLYFAADMKLGHYMKIPPKTLFFAQGSATILGALTQAGVTLWMLGHVNHICESDRTNGFSCPNGRTTFSSSIIWGAIGPGRVYSIGKIYSGLLHFFWLGAVLPIISWALWKYWKKPDGTRRKWLQLTNWPLIFVGTYNVPPATGINYSSWALVNIIINWWIKSRYFAWWAKYNYVLAAALDTGLALSALVIFFCITYPGGVFPDWWGNTVYLNTVDGNGLPWLQLPSSGYFGPANGTWH